MIVPVDFDSTVSVMSIPVSMPLAQIFLVHTLWTSTGAIVVMVTMRRSSLAWRDLTSFVHLRRVSVPVFVCISRLRWQGCMLPTPLVIFISKPGFVMP